MKAVLATAFAFACLASGAAAQGDFYRGKQLRMIVGNAVGGDYDVGARLLVKYMAKHIPGQPTIVVQNMPAAGSVVAANFLSSQAPRDGTVFGSFSRNVPGLAVRGQSLMQADPRLFNWLGATSVPSLVCVSWHTARVQKIEDVFIHELIVGASAGSSLAIIPTVLNHVLHTKFRIVEGYKGVQEAIIAIERGEVEGMCAAYGQFRNYARLIDDGKLRVFARLEETPIPGLADVPSIYDHARTEEQKQFLRFVFSSNEFGRPTVLPPGVPADRVAALRKAMADAANDPDLIADAARMKVDMTYVPPERLERILAGLYQTPPAMIEAINKLIPNL